MAKFKKKIICPVCGIEFQANRPSRDRITCSRKCSNIHKSQIVYKCICVNCGKLFDGNSPNANQCNDCRNAICLTCGKVFIKTKPYSKYCSRECVALDKDLSRQIGIKGSQTKVEKIAAGTFSIRKHEAKSHKCVNCGKFFLSLGPCPKYCDDCKTYTCEVCGRRFKVAQFGTNPKTCSLGCRGISQRNELVCKNCGKIFHGSGKHYFCNNDCKKAFQAIKENHPNYKGEYYEVTCAICGKNELIPNWRAKEFVTCSRKCGNVWKSRKQREDPVFSTCEICGKTYELKYKYRVNKQRVCSRECVAKLRSQERIGENNTFYGKHHSRETKETIGLKAAIRHAEGNTNYGRGEFISKLTGKTEIFDSSWELERFRELDQLGIQWTKKHHIRIGYWWENSTHYYVPDILVFLPRPKLEEIKPKSLVEKDEQTQAQLAAGKRWCAKRGYDFVILTEDDLFGNKRSQ